MKYLSYVLVLIATCLSSITYTAWRLGKPKEVIPTIQELNTFTLSPLKQTNSATAYLEIRPLITAIQHHKNAPSTELVVYEKTEKKDGLKLIKGFTTVTQGIQELPDEYITIACRGYALRKNPKNGLPQRGGGVVDAYSRLRNNICHTPLITFDFLDQRRTFNFAQELDQACLKIVYDEVVAKNPNAKIILTGDCRGALNVLKFAATNPKNLHALILTSPFVSAQELTQELAKNYLQRYFGKGSGKLLHNFFQWWFPNYDPQQDSVWEVLPKITNKNIFIAHRDSDTMVANETVEKLAKVLKTNNLVSLKIITDKSAKHAKLLQLPECQDHINAFLKQI